MIIDGVRSAIAMASADLPLAVGPAMSTRGGRIGLVFIATLVAPEHLNAGDISSACDRVRGRSGPLIDGVACDIVFDGDPVSARAALEGVKGIDVVVQRVADRHRRLLVADMDSTMITVECIDELADYAGVKAEISAVTERAMRGELDFAEALLSRVALLRGLSEETVFQCLRERVTIMPGAISLIRTLRAQGGRTVLVSGGFTHFTGAVAAQIGFDRAIANQLIVKDGFLTGEVEQPIVDAATKRMTLLAEANGLGISDSATLAIGDGANDILMIEAAGLGVAYHAKPKTEAAADACIRCGDLTVLLYAMGLQRALWRAD
jgi:phosphoserine phosphatase